MEKSAELSNYKKKVAYNWNLCYSVKRIKSIYHTEKLRRLYNEDYWAQRRNIRVGKM